MPGETPAHAFGRALLREIEFSTGLRSRCFLWVPRKLKCGKWAWLRWVERAYDLTLSREEGRTRHYRPRIIYEEMS